MPRWLPSPGEHATQPTQVSPSLQKMGPAAPLPHYFWCGEAGPPEEAGSGFRLLGGGARCAPSWWPRAAGRAEGSGAEPSREEGASWRRKPWCCSWPPALPGHTRPSSTCRAHQRPAESPGLLLLSLQSDQLQMDESLSITFEQGPLPPPSSWVKLGWTSNSGSQVEPRASLHDVALCLVSPCESERQQAVPMRLTPVSPGSPRDSAWSQELMGALGAQETPPTSVSKSLLSLSDSDLLRETADADEDTEGFGGPSLWPTQASSRSPHWCPSCLVSARWTQICCLGLGGTQKPGLATLKATPVTAVKTKGLVSGDWVSWLLRPRTSPMMKEARHLGQKILSRQVGPPHVHLVSPRGLESCSGPLVQVLLFPPCRVVSATPHTRSEPHFSSEWKLWPLCWNVYNSKVLEQWKHHVNTSIMVNFPVARVSKKKQVKLILIVYIMNSICAEVLKTTPRLRD